MAANLSIFSLRRGLWVAVFGCLSLPIMPFMPSLPAAAQDSFTEREATQLLQQIAAGLVSHNPKKMLAAFDVEHMSDGAIFTQNIASFFSQTGVIRVHFNLLRTNVEGAKGEADVSMEMEAEMRDDRLPPVHKQGELHLVCEKHSNGWLITDLTPRDFFSTQP